MAAVGSGQPADVGQCESQQTVVASGHLGPDVDAGGLIRREPGKMSAASRLLVGLPLDLNRASAADLQMLRGVGPRLAADIVAARTAAAGFARIESLRDVTGIGENTLERLRPFLTIAAAPSATGLQ